MSADLTDDPAAKTAAVNKFANSIARYVATGNDADDWGRHRWAVEAVTVMLTDLTAAREAVALLPSDLLLEQLVEWGVLEESKAQQAIAGVTRIWQGDRWIITAPAGSQRVFVVPQVSDPILPDGREPSEPRYADPERRAATVAAAEAFAAGEPTDE